MRRRKQTASPFVNGTVPTLARETRRLRDHLIDRLFYDCLCWDRESTVLEASRDGQHADYTFHAPRAIAIVEAKREGIYFEVPAGQRHLEASIPVLARDNPNLRSALEQVAEYCQSRGVPIGVVCNGHQIVAFIANRVDGMPPLEGRAIVFASYDGMLDRFLDLWQLLSRPGVEERHVFRRLRRSASAARAGATRFPGLRTNPNTMLRSTLHV